MTCTPGRVVSSAHLVSDRQRTTDTLLSKLSALQAQVQLTLTRGQTLPGDRPQDLQLRIVVCRPDVPSDRA